MKFCPKCKSDEAFGKMGYVYMCLKCGWDERTDGDVFD